MTGDGYRSSATCSSVPCFGIEVWVQLQCCHPRDKPGGLCMKLREKLSKQVQQTGSIGPAEQFLACRVHVWPSQCGRFYQAQFFYCYFVVEL